jgi:leucyl aminopeptidase
VLAVYEGKILSRTAQAADKAAGGALRHALAQGDLAAKAGATLLLHNPKGLAAARVLLVSLGARADYGVGPFREALRGAASAPKGLGARDATLLIADFAVAARGLPWAVRNAVLVVGAVFYRFDQPKTQENLSEPVRASLTLAIAGCYATGARDTLVKAILRASGLNPQAPHLKVGPRR